MSPKDEQLRANIKALIEKAARERVVNPNQVIIREPDGFEIISPGPGPRNFAKREAIKVDGEPISEMLIRERR